MKDVKIVEVVPKSVAQTASQISSVYEFRIINADPVVEFIIPTVSAGQSATVTYSVNKKVALSDFASMGSPAAKFTEITPTPGTNPDVTPDVTPDTTPDVTPDTTPDTIPTAPMDYTLLIIIVIIVIIGAAYFLVAKKK